MSDLTELQHLRILVYTWRRHIADVFNRRGREDVYAPNEVFHTCHGCGNHAGLIHQGLCNDCRVAIGELPFAGMPMSGLMGTDISVPYGVQRMLQMAESYGKPIITELPGLILPAGYERELPKPEYVLSFFAYETRGMALPPIETIEVEPGEE